MTKPIFLYTDGACSGNPGPGGWAYAVVDKEENAIIEKNKGSESYTTNNKMELLAAIEGLSFIKEAEIGTEVMLHTDSNYVLQSMTEWAHSWKQNDWTRKNKKTIENLLLIQCLYRLCYEEGLSVTFKKVKAHLKSTHTDYDPYNDYVDQLATGKIT